MRVLTLVAWFLFSGSILAQGYPSKPLKIVVGYPPGGSGDFTTRLIGDELSKELGVTVVVENRPGAGGSIASEFVARSPADGYTILNQGNHAINRNLYKNLAYDDRDFIPVCRVATGTTILVVNNNTPFQSLKELIAYAKANPGKLSFGSSGVGAAAHLTTELFMQTTGVVMVHVPYKGTAPALQDLMGGNIQILVDVPSTLMPQVRGGKIKALGMFSTKRVAGAAEVPTIAEAGGPPIEGSTWVLFLAPAGTPREIVNRMAAETAKAVASADIKGRFETIGIEPVGNTPEEAGKFLDDEIAKWAKVISTAGVKAEQ